MRSVQCSGCVPAEQLDGVASLPEQNERRRHVARCVRCRVTRRLFAEFRAPARRRLARVRALVPALDAMVEAIVAGPA